MISTSAQDDIRFLSLDFIGEQASIAAEHLSIAQSYAALNELVALEYSLRRAVTHLRSAITTFEELRGDPVAERPAK